MIHLHNYHDYKKKKKENQTTHEHTYYLITQDQYSFSLPLPATKMYLYDVIYPTLINIRRTSNVKFERDVTLHQVIPCST